jgi:hypothetical protein
MLKLTPENAATVPVHIPVVSSPPDFIINSPELPAMSLTISRPTSFYDTLLAFEF